MAGAAHLARRPWRAEFYSSPGWRDPCLSLFISAVVHCCGTMCRTLGCIAVTCYFAWRCEHSTTRSTNSPGSYDCRASLPLHLLHTDASISTECTLHACPTTFGPPTTACRQACGRAHLKHSLAGGGRVWCTMLIPSGEETSFEGIQSNLKAFKRFGICRSVQTAI